MNIKGLYDAFPLITEHNRIVTVQLKNTQGHSTRLAVESSLSNMKHMFSYNVGSQK